MAAPITSSGESVILQESSSINYISLNKDNLFETFKIAQVSQWIRDNGFKRVAFYFPVELHIYYPSVVLIAKRHLPNDTEIVTIPLEDGQGNCMMETGGGEVLFRCQALVHFGHCCTSCPGLKLPVRYVIVQYPITNPAEYVEMLHSTLASVESIILTSEFPYTQAVDELSAQLRIVEPLRPVHVGQPLVQVQDKDAQGLRRCGRLFPSISGDTETLCKKTALLHLGSATLPFRELMLSFPTCLVVVLVNPATGAISNETASRDALLRRRVHLMLEAQKARHVALVVKDFSQPEVDEILQRLMTGLKRRQCHFFQLVQAKLTEADMARWPIFEVFVLVGCPVHSLVDSRDYHFFRPLITPYEMEQALSGDLWNGEHFITDLSELVTRPLKVAPRDFEIEQPAEESSDAGPLSVWDSTKFALAELHTSHGTWYGLEANIGQTEVAKVAMGRKGIAIHYEEAEG